MNFDEKFVLVFALIIIIGISIASTTANEVTATDWKYRHSVWIDQYLKGDFSSIFEYPPLFELFMVPFVAVGFPVIWFQVIFSVCSITVILWFARKMEGEKSMLSTAVFLASSVAYLEFSSALMPQSFDFVLFPLICLAYFKNKYALAILGLGTIFFMHMIGFAFGGILLFHSLLTKRYKFAKILFLMMIIISPIFYYYEFYVHSDWDSTSQIQWEMMYFDPWWRFFALSGIVMWIFFPFAIIKLKKSEFKLNETQLLYVIWIIGFIPLGVFSFVAWRMFSYQIVPLSLLVASVNK